MTTNCALCTGGWRQLTVSPKAMYHLRQCFAKIVFITFSEADFLYTLVLVDRCQLCFQGVWWNTGQGQLSCFESSRSLFTNSSSARAAPTWLRTEFLHVTFSCIGSGTACLGRGLVKDWGITWSSDLNIMMPTQHEIIKHHYLHIKHVCIGVCSESRNVW